MPFMLLEIFLMFWGLHHIDPHDWIKELISGVLLLIRNVSLVNKRGIVHLLLGVIVLGSFVFDTFLHVSTLCYAKDASIFVISEDWGALVSDDGFVFLSPLLIQWVLHFFPIGPHALLLYRLSEIIIPPLVTLFRKISVLGSNPNLPE